jgi:elongation factor P hydroxylase
MTTNEKAPGACDSKGLPTDITNDVNSATGKRHSKAIATQIAHLVIAGHAVHQLTDGGYLVCKYGHTYEAKDFAALQAFARRLRVTK